MKSRTWVRWIGLFAVLACLAVPAFALEPGLYLVEGTTDHYWVDEAGVRHVVRDIDAVRPLWFKETPIVTTQIDVIEDLPLGEEITTTVSPQMVLKKTTTTTIESDGSRTTKTVETKEEIK